MEAVLQGACGGCTGGEERREGDGGDAVGDGAPPATALGAGVAPMAHEEAKEELHERIVEALRGERATAALGERSGGKEMGRDVVEDEGAPAIATGAETAHAAVQDGA